MKIGDKIVIERLPSGLYSIQRNKEPTLVGLAASTAIALNTSVFGDEANEIGGCILTGHDYTRIRE